MNRKRKISAVLLLLSLALSALPAGAVSFHSEHFQERFNDKGTSSKELPPHANIFCYLSLVSVEETDTGGEEAKCRVRRGSTVWILEATLDKSSDADVECRAICYNN